MSEGHDYDTTKGIVFVVELDGYYTKEQAFELRNKLIEKGFMAHVAEV
ncbi:MAG: hypothetical protein WC623_21710 [Pedobacter sp.]